MESLFGISVFFIAYLVSFLISIPLHEVGHLLFGLLTGYRFQSYRLLSFVWVKEGEKIVFKRSKIGLIVGQCLMSPPAKEEDFRFVLYNLGGGLLNLLCFVVAFIPFLLVPDTDIVFDILLGIWLASLLQALMNLVPLNIQLPNDGYNVRAALRSPEAKHGLYVMFLVNEQTAAGKRYRDFEQDMFKVSANADLSNFCTAYVLICESARLFDKGHQEESLEVLQRIPADKLPAYYRNSVYLEYLYDALVYHPNLPKAKELFAKKGMDTLLRMQIPPILRVQSAYEYFAKADRAQAAEYLLRAKNSLETYENKGICRMEADYLAELEQQMEL
jgi:hypothetical protein